MTLNKYKSTIKLKLFKEILSNMIEYDKVRKIIMDYFSKKASSMNVFINDREIYLTRNTAQGGTEVKTICWKLASYSSFDCMILGYSTKVDKYVYKKYKMSSYNQVDIKLTQLLQHCEELSYYWKTVDIEKRKQQLEEDF